MATNRRHRKNKWMSAWKNDFCFFSLWCQHTKQRSTCKKKHPKLLCFRQRASLFSSVLFLNRSLSSAIGHIHHGISVTELHLTPCAGEAMPYVTDVVSHRRHIIFVKVIQYFIWDHIYRFPFCSMRFAEFSNAFRFCIHSLTDSLEISIICFYSIEIVHLSFDDVQALSLRKRNSWCLRVTETKSVLRRQKAGIRKT